MSNGNNLVIPENLAQLLQRRNELWRKHDSSRHHFEQLQVCAARVPAGLAGFPRGSFPRVRHRTNWRPP